MYTSKHTSSISPSHQMFKPHRDTSPTPKYPQSSSKPAKYYSSQQVSRMIKSYIQPKILYLKNQLQQKQRIIQLLNQKLDQNDHRISKLYGYTQAMIKKHRQGDMSNKNMVIPLVNQLLNDKMKQYWQAVNGQITKIKQEYLDKVTVIDSKKIQAKIQYQLESIRKQTSEYVESSRQRNNNYWLKIKQALNRIHSKVSKVDETILSTAESFQSFRKQTNSSQEYVAELQKSKQVVKKLIQLKKSVKNIYQNYETVLQLQNQFKNRLGQVNTQSTNREQNSNDLINFDIDEENGNRKGSIQQGGNTFPMFRKRAQNNFIDEVYQSTDQNQQYPQNRVANQQSSRRQEGDEPFVLQYSREQHNNDSIQGPTYQRQAKEQQERVFAQKYYVPSTSKKPTTIYGTELSPSRPSPQSQSRFQAGLTSPNELSCLNSSSNAFRHGASRSTSFVNLSLQNRQQMSESIKERLQEIIELKNLQKPLLVYVDEINYLKNSEGNYIFDTKGNMFKLGRQDGKQLQRLGLIRFIEKNSPNKNNSRKNQLSSSNDNPYLKAKPSTSSSKVKSISIKQTAI